MPVSKFFSTAESSSTTNRLEITFDAYSLLSKEKTQSKILIQFHIDRILKSIKSKLKERQIFLSPWNPTVIEVIHIEIFYKLFRTIRDSNTIGVVCSSVKSPRAGTKSYTIQFSHLSSWVHHATKLYDNQFKPISEYLHKTFPSRSKATVVILPEKPLIITYKVSSSTCKLSYHYCLTNQHGVLVSYDGPQNN